MAAAAAARSPSSCVRLSLKRERGCAFFCPPAVGCATRSPCLCWGILSPRYQFDVLSGGFPGFVRTPLLAALFPPDAARPLAQRGFLCSFSFSLRLLVCCSSPRASQALVGLRRGGREADADVAYAAALVLVCAESCAGLFTSQRSWTRAQRIGYFSAPSVLPPRHV